MRGVLRGWGGGIFFLTHALETDQPMIVLAIRGRDTRPMDAYKITNWQQLPGGQPLRITTVVGEKLLLRIEEDSPEGE